ncbi:sister chromatid cohesion protein PDS5 homolog A-like [Magnolia sinica]|uniref:sister chromatid cohesion protein PDS5 homolog A-like n=1 Tax=Magnolia sinica TaxID=86752 RepID=UPI002659CFFD|nr:sister chromatid cohesion protein PDS5 homolog A-like [Magnolia sinica]
MQDVYPQARKLFLSKVLQYIKERLLDAKYACGFSFNITGSHPLEFIEDKHNLMEVVQMCHRLKALQLSMQRDVNSSSTYLENILTYLLLALSHHPSCPNVDECKEVQAFESIYWYPYSVAFVAMYNLLVF